MTAAAGTRRRARGFSRYTHKYKAHLDKRRGGLKREEKGRGRRHRRTPPAGVGPSDPPPTWLATPAPTAQRAEIDAHALPARPRRRRRYEECRGRDGEGAPRPIGTRVQDQAGGRSAARSSRTLPNPRWKPAKVAARARSTGRRLAGSWSRRRWRTRATTRRRRMYVPIKMSPRST